MAFQKKVWSDRVAEFINRRILTKTDGTTEIVTVARSEGTISAEGDGFNAKNMNDLEQRIEDEFFSQNETFAKEIEEINNSFVAPDYGKINGDNYKDYKNFTGQFTVLNDGYIIGYSRHETEHILTIDINGFTIASNHVTGNTYIGQFTSLYPVKRGDVVEWSTNFPVYEVCVSFLPLRR